MADVPDSVLAVTPALKPPPGITPDFTGESGLQTTWIVVDSIALVLTTLILSARVITKTLGKERVQIEDCTYNSLIAIKRATLTFAIFCSPCMGSWSSFRRYSNVADFKLNEQMSFAAYNGWSLRAGVIGLGHHQWDTTALRMIDIAYVSEKQVHSRIARS